MYPSSISKSLRQELGPESGYRDYPSLLVKLEEKPIRLVAFFLASFQSNKWSQQNGSFCTHIYKSITANVLKGRLDFDETIARLNLIFKFYDSQVNLSVLIDFTVQADRNTISMSKLVLMRASPVLKERFFLKPNIQVEWLQDFSPYLLYVDELAVLYHLLYSNDFSGFVNLNTGSLQRIIFQCKDWKCPQLEELQRMICRRIKDYNTAAGELALARFMGLTIVEEACKNYLDNVTFLVHKSKETGFDNYVLNDPVVEDNTAKNLYSPSELMEMGSKLNSSDYAGSMAISVDRFFLTFQNEHSLAVGCMKIAGANTMEPLQRWKREFKHSKVDKDGVTTLGADATYKLPDLSLIGILLYFENVNKLNLCKYSDISVQFLEKLKLKKNLTHLSFVDYQGCIDTLLPLVSKLLPNITTLEIWSKMLKAETLDCILKNLNELILIYCKVQSPLEMKGFALIEKLTLFSLVAPVSAVEAILKHCKNLKYLKIIGENEIFSYPESLEILVINSSLLERKINKGFVPGVQYLRNLKELHIVGDLNFKLSNFFVKLNPKFSTHFHNNHM